MSDSPSQITIKQERSPFNPSASPLPNSTSSPFHAPAAPTPTPTNAPPASRMEDEPGRLPTHLRRTKQVFTARQEPRRSNIKTIKYLFQHGHACHLLSEVFR
ncbi:hypothetical protein AALO_G00222830, partial [Alosa alosa]